MGEVTHLSKLAIQEVRDEANEARDRQIATVEYGWSGTSLAVDTAFFVASRKWRVAAIRFVPVIAGTDVGAVTGVVRKCTGVQAPAAGVALHAGSFDLKGAINTVVAAALTAVAADLELAIGDRLAFDLTGVSTAAVGIVSVDLIPI